MKVISNKTVRVKILDQEYRKLDAWARLASGEVSALGMVEMEADGPLITSLFLPRQVCTGSSCDMDQEDVGAHLCELMKTGEEGKLRAWVHSHADLGVFWSGTDQNTIHTLGSDPYLVSVVVNRKGEYKARIDITYPFNITLEDLDLMVVYPASGELENACRAELATKVTTPAFVASSLPAAANRFSRSYGALQDPRPPVTPSTLGWPLDLGDDDFPFVGGVAGNGVDNDVGSEVVDDVAITELEDRYAFLYDLDDLVEFACRAGGDPSLYTMTGVKGGTIQFHTEAEVDKAVETGIITPQEYQRIYEGLIEFRDSTLRMMEDSIEKAWYDGLGNGWPADDGQQEVYTG